MADAPRLVPEVSICIPTYNREDLVLRAVESALKQPLSNFEVLVVDNRSTDDTWAALESLTHPRLRCVRNSRNVGMFGNFNRCLELACAPLVRFLASDDRLHEGCVARELELMQANPGVAVLTTRGQLVTRELRRLGRLGDHLPPGIYSGPEVITSILWIVAHYGTNPLNYPSGIMLQRTLALRVGGFDSSVPHAADLDLWLRLLEHGDLAVTDGIGCDVTHHRNQDSFRSLREGEYIGGHYVLLQKREALLRARGVQGFESLLTLVHARCLYYALRGLLRRDIVAARSHWAILRRFRVRISATLIALVQIVWLRLAERFLGMRLVPARPKEPLCG
jgi:glycosyltransferase involved in cell wall biosynthesis